MADRNAPHPLAGQIEEIDAIVPSPSERAETIWKIIRAEKHNLTTWDTICFCAEALGFLSAEYPFLLDVAKRISIIVYHSHYNFPHLIDASTGIRPENYRRDSRPSEDVSGRDGQQAVRESQGDSGGTIRSRYGTEGGFTIT